MVNQLSIGKSKLSVGTDGEMNTRSVNVQNPFVNEVVSILLQGHKVAPKTLSIGTVGTDGKPIFHR